MTRRTAAELAVIELFITQPDSVPSLTTTEDMVAQIMATKPMEIKYHSRMPNVFPEFIIFERICKDHNVE